MTTPENDFVMVPREPTEEMLRAGQVAVDEPAAPLVGLRRLGNAYRAMLSAAPPVQIEAVAWRFKYRDCLGWLYRDERDWIPNEPYNVHDVQTLYASPVPSSERDELVEDIDEAADDLIDSAQYLQETLEAGEGVYESKWLGGVMRAHELLLKLSEHIKHASAWPCDGEGDESGNFVCKNAPDRDDIIEMCAKVADDYARDGRIYKEYACETADELAARIRGLKSSDATGEAG